MIRGCCGLTLVGSCLLTSLPQPSVGQGKRKERIKARKLGDQDRGEDRKGKWRKKEDDKAKQVMQRQSLTTSHRWADAQPGASKQWLTLLKLHFFPFLAEHNVTWYGIFVWLVWVLCPAVSPTNLLCPCQSVHWGTVPV